MNYSAILESLLAGKHLPDDQITWLVSETMQGKLTPAQVSGWLIALRTKGETPAEIAACACIMRDLATPIVRSDLPELFMDTCGTGGDRSHLINISTLVALTLASLGIPVAKHGNRAVSSASGSADVLESIGYPLEEDPKLAARRLADKNFAFFFAPLYHPAMRHAGPVRRELGVRTVFNVLGPLANPAAAPVQLMGVYARELLRPMTETLKLLGLKSALVVHSEDGLDEISPVAPTHYCLLSQGGISDGVFVPPKQNYVTTLDVLKAETREKSLSAFQEVIAGRNRPGAYMTALNAAFAKKLFDAAAAGRAITDCNPTPDEIVAVFDHIASGALADQVTFSR
jgi:anthranilate phosphoribosyltransferase